MSITSVCDVADDLLLQVWNEIIADNEQKLGKLGESKFIHMTVNGGGL